MTLPYRHKRDDETDHRRLQTISCSSGPQLAGVVGTRYDFSAIMTLAHNISDCDFFLLNLCGICDMSKYRSLRTAIATHLTLNCPTENVFLTPTSSLLTSGEEFP